MGFQCVYVEIAVQRSERPHNQCHSQKYHSHTISILYMILPMLNVNYCYFSVLTVYLTVKASHSYIGSCLGHILSTLDSLAIEGLARSSCFLWWVKGALFLWEWYKLKQYFTPILSWFFVSSFSAWSYFNKILLW